MEWGRSAQPLVGCWFVAYFVSSVSAPGIFISLLSCASLNAALKQGPDEILMQLNLFFEPKSKSTSFQVGLACFGLNQTQSFHLLVRSTGFYISPDPGSFDSWRVLFKL